MRHKKSGKKADNAASAQKNTVMEAKGSVKAEAGNIAEDPETVNTESVKTAEDKGAEEAAAELHGAAYELTFLHIDKEGVLHRRSINKSSLLWALCIPVLFVVLVVLLYEQRLSAVEEQNKEAQLLADTLRGNIITQATEADNLSRRIGELQQENDELTLTIAEKDAELYARQEKDEQDKIPGAYPILGSAQLILPEVAESEGAGGGDVDEEETDEEEEKPSVSFLMGAGCRVVAAGSGKITEITANTDGTVTIEIDHGNGYHSYYTGSGTCVLNKGEWANAGSVLLIPAAEGSMVIYRISRDGRDIDPMEFMEVDG